MNEQMMIAIAAALLGTPLAIGAGVIGYYVKEIRKNSQFRRWLTGEEIEHDDGELAEIEGAFGELREEIHENRRERKREHDKVWQGAAAIHTSLSDLVESWNRAEIGEEVEPAEHPFEYRGGKRADGGQPADRGGDRADD